SPAISTDVQILWKAIPSPFYLRASGFLPAPESSPLTLLIRARPFRTCRPTNCRFKQAGIVPDLPAPGKRKMCQGFTHVAHAMHSFSTSFILVQSCKNAVFFAAFLEKIFHAWKSCAKRLQGSLRKTYFTLLIFCPAGQTGKAREDRFR